MHVVRNVGVYIYDYVIDVPTIYNLIWNFEFEISQSDTVQKLRH